MDIYKLLKLSQICGWIWLIPEGKRAEAEKLHDRWIDFESNCAKERSKDLGNVKRLIADWKKSPEMAEFAKKARLRYLRAAKKEDMARFIDNREEYLDNFNDSVSDQCDILRSLIIEKAEKLKKKINGYNFEIAYLDGKTVSDGRVNDEQIALAMEYPIENIVGEVGINGRAKCCFHDGEGWNMDIRKNYAYCYVCGKSGNSINVYMAKHHCSFKEAVMSLSK